MLTFMPWLEDWPMRHPRASRALDLLFHPYVLFLMVTLAVFWPEGFNIGPTDDGWVDINTSPFFYGDFDTRVFKQVGRAIGEHLVRGGFQGWQITLFIVTVLRGMLAYEIAKRLFPRYRTFALVCGLVTLFHRADIAYFWVDSVGVYLALVLALAAILAAVIHLETGSFPSLLAMVAFQLLSCLTYTGFLLIILGMPALAWLLRRIAGGKQSLLYLAKAWVLISVFLVFQAAVTLKGGGREALVIDMSWRGVLSGFAYEAGLFSRSVPAFLLPKSGHALLVLAVGVFAFLVAAARASATASVEPLQLTGGRWRLSVLLVLGLFALAVLAYLPYAVSDLRFGGMRQLLMAGIFLNVILMLPLFFLVLPYLERRIGSRMPEFVALAAAALLITAAGLEIRDMWVGTYRAEEQLLAQVAATVPKPPSGAVIIVHLADPWQSRTIDGFYNRRGVFQEALRLMYHDQSLQAGFMDVQLEPFTFNKDGVLLNAQRPDNRGLASSYEHLILLDYPWSGKMQILDRAWLQQFAPKGTDLSAYQTGGYGDAPGPDAIICTMLERRFRPGYCR